MNGVNCRNIEELLDERALGLALRPEDEAAVREHVAGCPGCAAYAKTAQDVAKSLGAAPSIEPSPCFNASLAEKLHRAKNGADRQPAILVLLAALRQVRRLGWGAVIYSVMIICMGVVVFTSYQRPVAMTPVAEEGTPKGVEPAVVYVPYEEFGQAEPPAELKARVLENRRDPFEVGADTLAASEPEPRNDMPVLMEPRTLAELKRLPEPPAQAVLPTKKGRVSLAQARFETIKTSNPSFRLAVSAGILWLCKNQDAKDGHWAGGGAYSDAEVTAAATLAMMEAGFTASETNDVSQSLRAGVRWLIRQKRSDGMFAPPGPRQAHAQAMVCMALCEALRLSDQEPAKRVYRTLVQDGVGALMAAQGAGGSWGAGDAELTSLCLMSASSARAANLLVPARPYNAAVAWLRDWKDKTNTTGYASLEPTAGSSARKSVTYATIAEVLSEPMSGRTGENAKEAAELLEQPVVWESGDFFRWYGATLACYRLDGESWQKWRWTLLHELLDHQQGMGKDASKVDVGSWSPHNICEAAGRPYATAMALLSLTGSCGHSPIYGSSK